MNFMTATLSTRSYDKALKAFVALRQAQVAIYHQMHISLPYLIVLFCTGRRPAQPVQIECPHDRRRAIKSRICASNDSKHTGHSAPCRSFIVAKVQPQTQPATTSAVKLSRTKERLLALEQNSVIAYTCMLSDCHSCVCFAAA